MAERPTPRPDTPTPYRVLGISHDVLICSAALVVDGQVVAAAPEERFDRQKHSRVFPTQAIRWCLAQGGIGLGDVDAIAVGWNPGLELETIPAGYLSSRRWRTEHLSQVPARIQQLMGGTAAPEVTVSGAGRGAPPVVFVNHYDAHIGNAFFLSPWDEAAICVLDGRGERHTGLLARGRGTTVEPLAEVRFPHSIGLFYSAITQFLGFTPDGDEWKVMALGSAEAGGNEFYAPLRELVRVHEDGTFHLALEAFEFYNFFDRRLFSDVLEERLGPPRTPGAPLTQREERIAAAMQRVFEDVVAEILTALHRRTGLDRLVVSGGCFMNSVFNGKITARTPFREVFITSCPDDSGTSVGAALWLAAQRTGTRWPEPMRHSSWGPAYSDAACLDAARRYKLPNLEVVDDPARRAAADLVDGRILGWFQGGMEFGQRALGNRSILLDPRRADGKQVVNAAVKFREGFRPFAPSILAERAADWFECEAGTRVPFMERVFRFREEKRHLVPAVVHSDGTGRLQTVEPDTNPRYRALIEEFDRLTGVPLVLNTSFNLNGEPIVCSPEDAIRTFFTCALDVLYLGNVRIAKAP